MRTRRLGKRALTLIILCGTTVPLLMIDLNSLHGYRHWSLAYGIVTFKSAVWTMSANGSRKLGNSKHGADCMGKVMARRQFCFVMEIRESVRHLSGRKDYFIVEKRKRARANKSRWQFAGSGQALRSGKTGHSGFMFLL